MVLILVMTSLKVIRPFLNLVVILCWLEMIFGEDSGQGRRVEMAVSNETHMVALVLKVELA